MGKYSHYSEVDSDFEKVKGTVDEMSNRLWAMPLEEMRIAFSTRPPRPEDPPLNVRVERKDVPVRDGAKITVGIYKPGETKRNAPLFYVTHGGGWVIGGIETEQSMQRYIADRCKVIVVSVDYRLAPEYKYPYAVNDCFDVLKWCVEHASELGIDPKHVIVGGSSAGGNLAAIMAMKARDEGFEGTIVGQVLNVPMICHPQLYPRDQYELESYEQNKEASGLNSSRVDWFWESYLGDKIEPDAYHSPLLAKSFAGLPPALVQVAGMDPLRDEGIAYGEALKAAGVETRIEIFAGVPHGFGGIAEVAKSKVYAANVGDFIDELGRSARP